MPVRAEGEPQRRVTLVGDSHMQQILPALEPLAREQHWEVRTLVRARCPFSTASETDPADASCIEWNEAAIEHLAAAPPDAVVVSASRDVRAGAHRADPGGLRGRLAAPRRRRRPRRGRARQPALRPPPRGVPRGAGARCPRLRDPPRRAPGRGPALRAPRRRAGQRRVPRPQRRDSAPRRPARPRSATCSSTSTTTTSRRRTAARCRRPWASGCPASWAGESPVSSRAPRRSRRGPARRARGRCRRPARPPRGRRRAPCRASRRASFSVGTFGSLLITGLRTPVATPATPARVSRARDGAEVASGAGDDARDVADGRRPPTTAGDSRLDP